MKLSEFGYDLPEALIAQYPLKKRDHARLLVVDRQSDSITHDVFKNFHKYLPPRSRLVLNNSKVVCSRLLGTKESTGARIEVFLLNKCLDDYHYEVLMKPMKRLKNGDCIVFGDGILKATVVEQEKRIIRLNRKNHGKYIAKYGHMPLPPYIKRSDQPIDHTHYQTVYANKLGSVAAPTAGLHFTDALLDKIKKEGHLINLVTLHINYGTFKPVETDDITKHHMHTERYVVNESTFKSLVKAKKKGQSIVGVGTTSARVLETIARTKKTQGNTNIFIYPGIEFKWVDVLLTNFHLPFSTLLMLVYAFGGIDLMKKAYQEAIKQKYRFYSYGDAMLIT